MNITVKQDRDWTIVSVPTKKWRVAASKLKELGADRWAGKDTQGTKAFVFYRSMTFEQVTNILNGDTDGNKPMPKPKELSAKKEKTPLTAEAPPREKEQEDVGQEYIMDAASAKRMRGAANKITEKIEKKESTFSGSNLTPRRQRMIDSALKDAEDMRKVQSVMFQIADMLEKGNCPIELSGMTTQTFLNGWVKHSGFPGSYDEKECKRFNKLAITPENYESVWNLFIKHVNLDGIDDSVAKQRKMEMREKELIRKIPGYFPTPKPVIFEMMEVGDIHPRHKVLEPQAGAGAIVDMLKEYSINDVDCIEYNYSLRELLEEKGYRIFGADFFDYWCAPIYDRIIMNPPFGKLIECDHIQHAFEMLKTPGILVSVVPPSYEYNSTKKAVAFRDWLNSTISWWKVDLPKDSFKESGTGVNTQLLVITK